MSSNMIGAAAAANRENARRADGKFGEQQHTESGTDGQLGIADEPALTGVDRTLEVAGLGFRDEFEAWAGDYADDFDWSSIQDDFNDALSQAAPDGVSWGWSDAGPWIAADTALNADEVRQQFVETIGGTDSEGVHHESTIDFEAIATKHEVSSSSGGAH